VQLEYVNSDGLSVLFNVHAFTNHTTGPSYHQVPTMYAANGITQIPTPANVVNPTCGAVFGLTGAGQDCFGYRNTNPNWQVTDTNRQPIEDLDTNGASVTVTDKFGSTEFTSISAYEHVHKYYGEDTDAGPFPAIAVTNPLLSKEFTQEFRLAGKTDKAYWTTGLYYFYRDVNTGSDTDLSGVGFVNDAFDDELISRSAAIFGQMEYSLPHDFTLIGGLRYSYDDQNFRILSSDLTGLTPTFLGITTAPVPNYNVFPFTGGTTTNSTAYTDSRTDNLVTYRGELDWKPIEGFLAYGSISKGTKSAGWNAAIDGSGLVGSSTPQTLPYAPEKLLSYEIGFKDNIQKYLRLNGALFYYDYKDFQAFTFQGLTQQISNLPATVKGAELELQFSPTSNWDLNLGASTLDSAVKGVKVAVAGVSPLETVVLPDREMVLAPKYEVNGSLRYHFPVAADKDLAFQVDSRYVGKQYFDLTNDPVATEGGHNVSNGSITLSGPDARWTVSFWVKNMFARQYLTYVIPVTSLGYSQYMVGEPRWFGGTIRYRW
jgi:iron complex outermembrane recepter protein